jgi:hypothetical protein
MAAITITNAGHNFFRDSLAGVVNAKIRYFAVGSSSTAPTVNDTILGAETFRKAVTSYTIGATGEILVNVYVAPGDIVGADVEEIGIIAGSSATGAANTGVLIAHGLYAHPGKTALESIQLQLDITL